MEKGEKVWDDWKIITQKEDSKPHHFFFAIYVF